MPRGNRHRLAGYVWHITERCHRRQFLLKFARDRRNWIRWLYEARKRFAKPEKGRRPISQRLEIGRLPFFPRLFTETGATGHAARVARTLQEQGT
jgi:putative transposase